AETDTVSSALPEETPARIIISRRTESRSLTFSPSRVQSHTESLDTIPNRTTTGYLKKICLLTEKRLCEGNVSAPPNQPSSHFSVCALHVERPVIPSVKLSPHQNTFLLILRL
ncbi:uncharacterized, partial [Tachysurus ichikawai]